jgi:chromosome segregation ATPase
MNVLVDANKALQTKVRSLKDKIKDKKRKHAEKAEKLYDRIDRLIEEKRKHAEKADELYARIDRLIEEKAALETEVARANTQARRAEDAAKAMTRQKNEMHDRLIDANNYSVFLRRKVDELSVECQRLRAENTEHTAFRRELTSAIEDTLSRRQAE